MGAPFSRENRFFEIAAELRRLAAELEKQSAESIVEQADRARHVDERPSGPIAIPSLTHSFAPPPCPQGAWCCDALDEVAEDADT